MFYVFLTFAVITSLHRFNYCVFGGVLSKRDSYRLEIVHYNDFHDRFEETSVFYPICKTNGSECIGGFARLYYEVQALLKTKSNPLLLNAGDVFQGTYWYNIFKWNVTQRFINLLPNDVHTIGNHEFDDGIAGLVPYLSALKAPVVISNIDTSQVMPLEGLYEKHVILHRNGRKIGVFGLITPLTKLSSKTEGVLFLDPIETAKKEAMLLAEKGVDIIILLSHCGLPEDLEIARVAGDYIDVIVGGHSHSLLWNGASPSKEQISGPYPIVVNSETNPGHKVLVVTASAYSKYLGNIDVDFDDEGEIQHFEANPVFLNRSIPEDLEIKALLQPYKDYLYKLVHEVIGYTAHDLSAEGCSLGECPIGDLVADAFLDAAKEIKFSNLTPVAFLLRNMIRGSIEKGDITRGAIINSLPYSNKVMTFVLSGRLLWQALEACMAVSWVAKPFQGPYLPQLSAGLRVTMNTTERHVVSVMVQDANTGEYQPLDLDKDYQVITVDFLTMGGNGFYMLKNPRNLTYVTVDAHALENYIKKMTPIRQTLDNRLTILN